jgi:hypothetical protein
MDEADRRHLRRAIELARLARELFARGNRRALVEGPCPELEAEARAVHAGFWR